MCGQPGLLLRHHVVTEAHVRLAGGDPWDLRNALAVGAHCRCHSRHHQAAARIARATLPSQAVQFAVDLLGEAGAELYLSRFYR